MCVVVPIQRPGGVRCPRPTGPLMPSRTGSAISSRNGPNSRRSSTRLRSGNTSGSSCWPGSSTTGARSLRRKTRRRSCRPTAIISARCGRSPKVFSGFCGASSASRRAARRVRLEHRAQSSNPDFTVRIPYGGQGGRGPQRLRDQHPRSRLGDHRLRNRRAAPGLPRPRSKEEIQPAPEGQGHFDRAVVESDKTFDLTFLRALLAQEDEKSSKPATV